MTQAFDPVTCTIRTFIEQNLYVTSRRSMLPVQPPRRGQENSLALFGHDPSSKCADKGTYWLRHGEVAHTALAFTRAGASMVDSPGFTDVVPWRAVGAPLRAPPAQTLGALIAPSTDLHT